MQGIKGSKKRTKVIGMRVTPEEKRLICEKAKKFNITMTQFILKSCLGEFYYDSI